MKVLSLHSVTRRFGDFVAVKDLSFSMEQGKVVGFLGADGAGKTTTLRTILDILRPTSGRIEVLGGPPGREHASEIGFLQRARTPGRQKAAAPLIERFGLSPFADRNVERLSKGMGQKVQLVTALVNSPRLLLLDEPFSGLDPVNQAVLQDKILAAAHRGSNILFSTHVMEHRTALHPPDHAGTRRESFRLRSGTGQDDVARPGTEPQTARLFAACGRHQLPHLWQHEAHGCRAQWYRYPGYRHLSHRLANWNNLIHDRASGRGTAARGRLLPCAGT